MLLTLVEPQPGYQRAGRFQTEQERRFELRQIRELTKETAFFCGSHEPSRRYSPGRVFRGRSACFSELDPGGTIPGVRLRPKGFGGRDEVETPWACQSAKIRNENGRHGVRPQALRFVAHAAWTLSGFKQRLSFWTITLPTSLLLQLREIPSGWSLFSARIHKELQRQLKKRRQIAWWLSVTELQGKRSAAEGMPCPHLHVLFVGKHSGKNKPWLLEPEELDAIIEAALRSAGVELPEDKQEVAELLKAAGQVVKVKKDAGKYVAKYLSKGSGSVSGWNDPAVARGLYISQWWHCSRPLLHRARAHQPVLHGDIAWWALKHCGQLEQLGIARVTEYEAGDFSPAGVKVLALRPDGILIIHRLFASLCHSEDPNDRQFVPALKPSRDWTGTVDMSVRVPLSRGVRIRNSEDVTAVGTSLVPAGNSNTDNSSVPDGDRIHGPLTDVLKERLELIYREVDIPEPVFATPGILPVECQFELPIDLGLAGSAWDVGATDGWDPYWDDPGWRGGPPR